MVYYLVLCALVVILVAWIIYHYITPKAPINFKDNRVLITGGSSGIGEYLAYRFSEAGALVTIVSNQQNDVIHRFNF